MARIKLGALIDDIRGTIKNQVYSIWKSGVHYVRSKAGIISNPESLAQGIIREAMTVASKRWYDTLDQGQRDNWNEFAAGLDPKEGGAGGILNLIPQNRGIMSGFNAYCMCYALIDRCQIDADGSFDDSPLGQTPPSSVTGLGAAWNDPLIVVTWTDPVTVIEDSKVRVWARTQENIFHRQLVSCEVLTTETSNIGSLRGAQGGGIAVGDAPGHYLIQADCIQPNGLKGPPSQTVRVIVT